VPRNRQTLLFSATFLPEIKALAAQFLKDPVEIQVAAANAISSKIAHRAHPVSAERKRELVVHLLNKDRQQTLIFCRTKDGADRIAHQLKDARHSVAVLHSNRTQRERVEALEGFKDLARLEGILPALESSHAIAYTVQLAPTLTPGSIVLVNLSGRGDKDVQSVIEAMK